MTTLTSVARASHIRIFPRIARPHRTAHLGTLIAVLTILLLPLVPLRTATAQEATELQINSTRYIVMNADTGAVFAQKDAHERVAIASLTKIFTAIEALELAPLDTQITTNESDLMSADATTMGFGPGETYTLEDLLYGMLLPSGNDAAHAIARALGYQEGDTDDEAVQRFMDLVNQRIQDMGLQDTHLVRPDGWGVEGHYSSAWDVAAFMSYAMNYPTFVNIIGTSSYTTSNGLITVSQSNKMINSYAALIGGKTGYDDDAGWCLVNLAQEDGTRMIAVTLDGVAPDDWYDDNRVLLDYGFGEQASLDSTNQAFSGDIVSYADPDVAAIARSAQPSSDVPAALDESHDETAQVEPTAPPAADVDTGEIAVVEAPAKASEPIHRSPAAATLALALGALLVLLPGVVTWRSRWGRIVAKPGVRAVDTPTDTP